MKTCSLNQSNQSNLMVVIISVSRNNFCRKSIHISAFFTQEHLGIYFHKKPYHWYLTLSWWRSLSERDQSKCKSMDWFLYDRNLRQEIINRFLHTPCLFASILTQFSPGICRIFKAGEERSSNKHLAIHVSFMLEQL